MLAREALLSALIESEQVEVKPLNLACEIWIRLHNIFEGDENAKKYRFQSWICMFEGAKMQEYKTIRGYFSRIYMTLLQGLQVQWKKIRR